MEPTHITSIVSPTLSEHKAKGSRFLGYAYPLAHVDDLKPLLQKLYDEHPKAVHWCYAYRLGSDGMQFRANDDGEPSGSAGMPILRQIDSAGLSDVVVIVVRYFGGTLLGVPGLIQAYKQATILALQDATRIEKPILKTVCMRFSYEKMSEVMRLVKRSEAQMLNQDMAMEVSLTVAVPQAHYANFMQQVQDWHWLQQQA